MADTLEFVHALYCDFFERGVRYFFPEAGLTVQGAASEVRPWLTFGHRTDGALDLEWMGSNYHLARAGRSFTEDQQRLLAAIGGVLSTRYRSIFFSGAAREPALVRRAGGRPVCFGVSRSGAMESLGDLASRFRNSLTAPLPHGRGSV